MHDNIAIKLLKTLDGEEMKSFSDYIRSPFFNKSSVLVKLFDLLSKYHPVYKSRILDKNNLYKKIYPGKIYNEQNIKNRMTELSALIKDFLSRKDFEKDHLAKKINLTRELYRRKEFILSERQADSAFNRIEEGAIRNIDFFRNKIDLFQEVHHLYLAKDSKMESLRLARTRAENLVYYFLISLMHIETDITIGSIELKETPADGTSQLFFDNFNFRKFLESLKEKDPVHYPQIAIYYFGHRSMLEPENEEIFYELKELIFENYFKFDKLSMYNFWGILSNSAFLLHLNKGKKFVIEAHEIDKFFISNNLYPEDRPFSSQTYQNTIIIATMVNAAEWAEKFANDYKEKLVEDTRENRFNYAMALIEFEKKNYERSISYLSKLEFNTVFDKINARIGIIKNYYELGFSEQVISMLDSVKHYANESREFPDHLKDRVKKMLKHLGKAAAAKFNMEKLDYADYMEAENDKPFQQSDWVIEKMKELL